MIKNIEALTTTQTPYFKKVIRVLIAKQTGRNLVHDNSFKLTNIFNL